MPTPLEIILNPVSLFFFGIYGALIVWEALFPGRRLPVIKYWKIRGLLVFVCFFLLSSYIPLFIDPFFAPYRIFDLTQIGVVPGAIVGVLVYELFVYIWHRSMHGSDLLWKTFHQMHHSAERLDTFGAFYFSPMDALGWSVMGSISFTLLVGLDPQAVTAAILFTNFLGVFQHANIKTPSWLGYIIQRPESHTVHHAKEIHAYNYSDLPLYDIIFGTFKNPKQYEYETGFYEGASKRIPEMLIFKKISEPKNQ